MFAARERCQSIEQDNFASRERCQSIEEPENKNNEPSSDNKGVMSEEKMLAIIESARLTLFDIIPKLIEYAKDDNSEISTPIFRNLLVRLGNLYPQLSGGTLSGRLRLRTMVANTLMENNFISHLVKLLVRSVNAGLPTRFLNSEGKLSDQLYKPTYNLMATTFNYSDHSAEFGKILCKDDNYLNIMARIYTELRHEFFQNSLAKKITEMVRMSISALYNLMLHEVPENLMRIRDLGLIESVRPYLNSEAEHIQFTALLFIIYAASEEESKVLLNYPKSIDYVIRHLKKAFKDKFKRSKGLSCIELAKAVERLARNDSNKRQLVDLGVLPVLIEMTSSTILKEREVAWLSLWSLSFDPDIAQEITVTVGPGLHQTCTVDTCPLDVGVSEEEHADCVSKVEKARLGLRWILNNSQEILENDEPDRLSGSIRAGLSSVSRRSSEASIVEEARARKMKKKTVPARSMTPMSPHNSTSPQKKESQQHIMISYSWAQKEIIIKVYEHLKKFDLPLWIDIEKMTGNTLDAMANAVENSSHVLIAMSSQYKSSQNCRSEAEYAYRLGKEIIPLNVEPKYRADGWLGFVVGTKLYFDFSGKYPFENKMTELLDMLRNCFTIPSSALVTTALPSPLPQPAPSKPTSVVTPSSSGQPSFTLWNNDRVIQWANEHDIKSLVNNKMLTGKHLGFMKRLLREAPNYFYSSLESKLHVTSIDDIMHFVEALELTV